MKVENLHLKAELSRTRRDLMEFSIQQSEKSRAMGGNLLSPNRGSTAKKHSKSYTRDSFTPLGGSLANTSLVTSTMDSSETQVEVENSAFSPLASPKRPQSISLGSHRRFSLLATNSLDNEDSSLQVSTAPLPHLDNKRTCQSTKPKTSFVGSGLGLVSSASFNPKGSAKQMLRKIMNDFNDAP